MLLMMLNNFFKGWKRCTVLPQTVVEKRLFLAWFWQGLINRPGNTANVYRLFTPKQHWRKLGNGIISLLSEVKLNNLKSSNNFVVIYWRIHEFRFSIFSFSSVFANFFGLENVCTSIYIGTGVDLNVQDVSTFTVKFTLDFRNIFTSILHQQLFTVCQTQVEGWGLGMIQAVTIYI